MFIYVQLRKQSLFNARKKFQFAILCVRAMIRIKRLRYTAEPLDIEEAMRDPYRVKVLRKVIDKCQYMNFYNDKFIFNVRLLMLAHFEFMDIGSRRVRVKIVLLCLKIHQKLNYTIFTSIILIDKSIAKIIIFILF